MTAILGLLQRMFEVNAELTVRPAHTSRKRPPNESLRRLQIELPLMFAPAANDFEGPPAAPEIDLEGRPTCARASSKVRRARRGYRRGGSGGSAGRRRRRRTDARSSTEWQWCCPKCGGRTRSLWTKVSEKLDIEAALYFIRRTMRETVACIDCREYMCTADRPDEVVDRRILDNNLLTEASSITTTTRFLESA